MLQLVSFIFYGSSRNAVKIYHLLKAEVHFLKKKNGDAFRHVIKSEAVTGAH
jgi:hypothetical protein